MNRRSTARCTILIALVVIDVLGLAGSFGSLSRDWLIASLAVACFAFGREVGL